MDERQLFEPIESVQAASRFEQRADRAPATVTVVTGEEIRKYGYRTLADVLQSVGGFYAVDDHNYVTLGVRGFARPGDFNTRVLFLLDGRRINDPVFDSALLGTEGPIDVELIERLEVVRGPGSSGYGANGLFAVVNIVTRRGRDLDGAELGVAGGSLGTAGARAAWGRRGSGWEALVSASYRNSDGATFHFPELDTTQTSGVSAQGMDRDRYARVFANTAFRDFTLLGAYVWRRKTIPTGSYGVVFNDPRDQTTDQNAVLDLGWKRLLRSQDVLEARVFYNRSLYDGAYPYDRAGPGESPRVELLLDGARGERWGAELQHTLKPLGRHRALWGGELRDDVHQDQWIRDVDYAFDSRRRSWGSSLFAQDEVTLSSAVVLNVGGRLDWYQGFGTAANPRLGLIVQTSQDSTLKLLFGRAFRPPNAYELSYDDGSIQKGNPDLKPETIVAYEVGYQRSLGRHLRGSLGVYYYRLSGLVGQDVDPADDRIHYVNVGLIEAPGIEAELEARSERGIEARASWAVQRARDASTEERLSNSPTHLGKLMLGVPLVRNRLSLSAEALYTSERRTLKGASAGGFVLVNATLLGRRLYKGLHASLGVSNALDTAYGVPGGSEHVQDVLPQRGRTFDLEVWYGF